MLNELRIYGNKMRIWQFDVTFAIYNMTKAKQHTFIGTYKYTHITQLNKKQANKTEK